MAILRRDSYKNNWELIKWELESDTFTRGQWLTKVIMNGSYGAISTNGKYFTYEYTSLRPEEQWKQYNIVSTIPYFTAAPNEENVVFMKDNTGFVKDGTFVDDNGRTITTEQGILYANGSVLYDSRDHVFTNVPFTYEVLQKQYDDPNFVDGVALYMYDGNVVEARKSTVERIKRDME